VAQRPHRAQRRCSTPGGRSGAAQRPGGGAALLNARGAERRCSAPGGRSARQQQRIRRSQQPQINPGERLDKTIVWIHREKTRHTCAPGMTARHSPLFTLRSGQSGLGIYTSQRDAAGREHVLLDLTSLDEH
jgi:hypothetical protein